MIEVSGPEKTIESSFRSFWIAAGNPVPFTFQRQDYEAQPSEDATNFLRVIVPGNVTAEAPIGSQIYHSEVGRVLIVTNSFYDIGNNHTGLETGALFGSGTTAGFVNLLSRKKYRLLVNVVLDDELRDEFTTIGKHQEGISEVALEPFSDGFMSLDVAYLLSRLANEDVMDYAMNNAVDPGRSMGFYLIFQETWEGSGFINRQSTPELYFIVRASKQIGDPHGQNMAEYTPISPVISLANQASFLTRFTQSRYWEGWPFALSFIYSPEISGDSLRAVERELDNAINEVGDSNRFLDISQPKNVHKLTMVGGYSAAVKFVDICLETGDVTDADSYYVNGYFVDENYI